MRSYAPSSLVLTIAVLVSFTTWTCSAQSNQTCSMLQPVSNFSIDCFLGTWHGQKIYARLAENAKPLQFRCLDIVISRTQSTFLPILAEERFISIEDDPDYIVVPDYIHFMHENEAIWKMVAFYQGQLLESDSVMVQTDYANWAIFFGCSLEDNGRREQMQIWTRTRTPDPELIAILETVVQNYGFALENGRTVVHTNC